MSGCNPYSRRAVVKSGGNAKTIGELPDEKADVQQTFVWRIAAARRSSFGRVCRRKTDDRRPTTNDR